MRPSRRDVVQWIAAGGIAVSIGRHAHAQPAGSRTPASPPSASRRPAGRIDGRAKVLGQKLYVSDFRAVDMPGWPATTAHALLLRTPDATHLFAGLDLTVLPEDIRPAVVVTAEHVAAAGIVVPEFYAGELFCPAGAMPLYLGQPVALLLFETFDAYDRARVILRDTSALRFGSAGDPVYRPNYAAYRFTRVAGPTPDSPDVYAPVDAGWISPGFFDGSGRPIWRPLPVAEGGDYAAGARYGEAIRAELDTPEDGTAVLRRTFKTQSMDPMFLEPECGLAWFDGEAKALSLLLGVQSPYEAAEALATLLGEAAPAVRPVRIDAKFASIGGGFGGRDHTPFPLYVALAAVFLPGRPVRLAHDRFQQFQGGIKRHAFDMTTTMGIDRASGRIVAFAADHVLDGGGLANYSASVATVAATGAIGIYDVPKVDVTTVAFHSRGVTAGSMRGYGTLQTLTALETLIDEAAAAVGRDPIAFRRLNALPTGGRTMTGNPYSVAVRTPEILDKLEAHRIWTDRARHKTEARPGVLVGTGVACVNKDYGTGADCALGRVEIDPDGRIAIHCDHVEMGNAIGTALANRVARHLGGVADRVVVADVEAFAPLELVATADPYTISQAAQDEAARNPRWTPAISSATSASIGAHVGTQAAAEAARAIFRFGLWPAALAIWGIAPGEPRADAYDEAFWQGDMLLLAGLPPLPLARLAARAHADRGVTGAMAHAFSRWAWAGATFPVGDTSFHGEIDALALRRGAGDYRRLERIAVAFPPADYNRIGTAFVSMCGTAVRIEIEPTTGTLRIAEAYSVLECGDMLVPEVVIGQAQGGFAMGVGYALLETLPPYEDGPGNGRWNLGDYLVARASDLPLGRLEIEVLPKVSANEPPKGMAEVVMIPVVAALLNAVADATGKRFNALPVTADVLRGALA